MELPVDSEVNTLVTSVASVMFAAAVVLSVLVIDDVIVTDKC